MPFNSNHWITDPEYIELINYIIDQTKSVESPMSVQRLTREFKEKSGAAQTAKCLKTRIYTLRAKIHSFEHIDTTTKVKLMFALSASVNAGFLKELEKNAFVVIDEKRRITYYNANDGSLELSGDHSHSAKTRTGVHQSERSLRPLINNYFEKKNNAVPTNEGEGEMWKLVEFIIGKCDKVNSPLSITRLAEDFVEKFRVSTLSLTVRKRIRGYALEIQRMEFVDTRSKVQQLFGLSAAVNSDCLEKLRENALVEVDEKNRIVVYKANDGSIELRGDHSRTAKIRTSKLGSKQNPRSLIINNDDDDDKSENEIVHSEDDSDEHSSSEFDFDDDNNHLDKSEDHIEPSNKVLDDYNDNPCRIHSPTEMSNDNNFDFDPSTERSQRSGETEMREDDGRKRKNSSRTTPIFGKKRNKGATGVSSSNWTGSFSNNSMRPNELDDYDTNYLIGDQIKFEPVFGSTQEDLNEFKEDADIQQFLKPPQALDEHNQIEVVSIKIEIDDPKEIKPEIAHNSKLKFFEAMHSLLGCLDTPSLAWIQSKIHQKIQKLGESDEMILNNEISLIIQLLIARMTNHSVENLSKNVESVSLPYLLCYLKAAIQISKLSGVDDLVKNISELIEESQNKRIPIEKVANALRATLNID